MSRRFGGRGSGRRGGGGAAAPFDFNSISGLVLDLDARDKTAGAITSWTDRKFGDVFAGAATRDAAFNSVPTISFTGANILQLAAWARLNGEAVLTFVYALKSSAVLATEVITELGNTGSVAGSWAAYISSGVTVRNYALGNVGATQGSVSDTMTPAAVWTFQADFSLATNECGIVRKNGVLQSVTNSPNGNNTGTFATNTLAIGSRSGSLPWAGSIAKIVAYSGPKTAGELQAVERGVGAIALISVA